MNAPLLSAEPDADELSRLIIRVMRGVNGQSLRLFGNRVINGPFVGMVIPECNSAWDDGNFSTKLLGTYEFELHEALKHAGWRRPRVVVNVGCAEGYYTVGLARGLPKAQVYGFDTSLASLDLCAEYAKVNGVQDRVSLAHGCTFPESMSVGAEGHRLYVIDVEGAEVDLVDLERCPDLVNADLIIECHDCIVADASAKIADRLYATHSVELIRPRLPDLERFQFLKTSPAVMSVLMAVEKRPMPIYWIVAWAKQKGLSDG